MYPSVEICVSTVRPLILKSEATLLIHTFLVTEILGRSESEEDKESDESIT
jgi:hypothetical protein